MAKQRKRVRPKKRELIRIYHPEDDDTRPPAKRATKEWRAIAKMELNKLNARDVWQDQASENQDAVLGSLRYIASCYSKHPGQKLKVIAAYKAAMALLAAEK